jgi:hypothetical protein
MGPGNLRKEKKLVKVKHHNQKVTPQEKYKKKHINPHIFVKHLEENSTKLPNIYYF